MENCSGFVQLRILLALSTKMPSLFLLFRLGLSGTTTKMYFRCTDFSYSLQEESTYHLALSLYRLC